MTTVERYASAAYALLVAGAALSPWPWTCLLVAGTFLAFLAFVSDRREGQPYDDSVDPDAAPHEVTP